MERHSKHNKKTMLLFMIVLFAGIADIKYQGLLFRLLPKRAQEKLSHI